MPRCLPPTMIREAVIIDSVVGDGCIINVSKSILHILSEMSFYFVVWKYIFDLSNNRGARSKVQLLV